MGYILFFLIDNLHFNLATTEGKGGNRALISEGWISVCLELSPRRVDVYGKVISTYRYIQNLFPIPMRKKSFWDDIDSLQMRVGGQQCNLDAN